MTAHPLTSLTYPELASLARAHVGTGHGAARAIYRDAFQRGRFAPAEHGLGAAAARRWSEAFSWTLPTVVRAVQEPSDQGPTTKIVLQTADGLEIECVRFPMGHGRHALCVSSQVGCKMGCVFCETGRMGLVRSLAAAEIVGQVLTVRHALGSTVDRVVFMGMGEPLDNWDAVVQALRVLADPAGLAFSHDSLTVSTVGEVRGLEKLAALGWPRLDLSVSLTSADDETRARLIPAARRHPLEVLQAALVAYRPRRNFCFRIAYCLIPGLNDARRDAARVAEFCKPLGRVMVNVIPYNPGTHPIARVPREDEVARFIDWLRDEGLPVRRRVTKGAAVMAACGQLGNVELRVRGRASARTRPAPAARGS